MPWAPVTEPSLALGILRARLKADGVWSRVWHANIELLRHVTYATYNAVAEMWGLNEFAFTQALAGEVDETQLRAIVERCEEQLEGESLLPRYSTLHTMVELCLKLRDETGPHFLEQCAETILADSPTMVGMSCMFDQTLASVALAKLIKAKSPGTAIVLGGYALQGPPGDEVLKAFPWIDCIARGDGENIITPLARASVGEGRFEDIAGVLTRLREPLPAKTIDLDTSPNPDYDDWFADLETMRTQFDVTIKCGTLSVESSRGCWWGQHKHCVFCGIDEETLKFRHKSADKVLTMLAELRERYGDLQFRFSDYILPRPYFEELLPRLAEVRPRYTLQCEIKANQTPAQVRALALAGFAELQPGIESFSSPVLQVMDKGVSAIQNVALLKYGYVERVVIHYNFLYGLPGEREEEYEQMLLNIPRIYHFMPPVSRSETIVTRFAPMQADPARFGSAQHPRHHRCYDVLFSQEMLRETGFSLDDYGYYFQRYLDFVPEMSKLYSQVVLQINHWKKQHQERDVYLGYETRGDGTYRFTDTRYGSERQIALTPLETSVYQAFDALPRPAAKVASEVAEASGRASQEVQDCMRRLDDERLVWCQGNRWLGLGVPMELVQNHMASQWRKSWVGVYL